MGAFKGYFDDSSSSSDPACNCVVFAGYIGDSAEEWPNLEEHWSIALRKAGVPYLHMKELMHIDAKPTGSSVYEKWRGRPNEVNAFLLDMAAIINSTALTPVASAVEKSALANLNKKHGLSGSEALEAETMAIYACCWLAQDAFGEHVQIEIQADRVTKPSRRLGKVEEISEHESREVPLGDYITVAFRPQSDSSRNWPALQVADFFAWETNYFVRNRIRNGGAIVDKATRLTYSILSDKKGNVGMFLNDRTLNVWDAQKQGAWPGTQRGRVVKSINEFWEDVRNRFPTVDRVSDGMIFDIARSNSSPLSSTLSFRAVSINRSDCSSCVSFGFFVGGFAVLPALGLGAISVPLQLVVR